MSQDLIERMQRISLMQDISSSADRVLSKLGAVLPGNIGPKCSGIATAELNLVIPSLDLRKYNLLPAVEKELTKKFFSAVKAMQEGTLSRYVKFASSGMRSPSLLAKFAGILEAQFAITVSQTRDSLLSTVFRSGVHWKKMSATSEVSTSICTQFCPASKPVTLPIATTPKNKRRRTAKPHAGRIFSEEAEKLLEETFATTPNVRGALKKELADRCGVQPNQITTWFQNTRNRRGQTSPRKNKRTASSSSTLSLDSAPSPSRSDRSCSPCPSLSSSTSSVNSPSSSTPEEIPLPYFDSSFHSTPQIIELDSNISTFFQPDLLKSLEPKFDTITDFPLPLPPFAIEPIYQLPESTSNQSTEHTPFYQLPETSSPVEVTGLDWTDYLAGLGNEVNLIGREESTDAVEQGTAEQVQEIGQEWDWSALLGMNESEIEKDETVGLAL